MIGVSWVNTKELLADRSMSNRRSARSSVVIVPYPGAEVCPRTCRVVGWRWFISDPAPRVRRYPSDTTDGQWAVIDPLLPDPAWLGRPADGRSGIAGARSWMRSSIWSITASSGGRCRSIAAGQGRHGVWAEVLDAPALNVLGDFSASPGCPVFPVQRATLSPAWRLAS